MSELAEPIALSAPEEGILSRLVSVRLRVNREIAAYSALMVVAASMRFWDLGSRALHHDEALHAWTAWKLFEGQGYLHEPFMHGPFQFFGTALTFFLFGVGDYSARIFPAIFGSALVALPYFLRHRLGTLGAWLTAAGIAISPTLLYSSRFARNDIYIAVFTFGLVICLWRYIDERKSRYLYLAALLLGLSFASMTSTYINVAILIAALNVWMAVHFWRQVRDRHKLDAFSSFNAFVLLLPFAWAVAALWPFTPGWRKRIGLRNWHPAADFLIVLGTLSVPQFAAAIKVPLDGLLGIDDADLAQKAIGHLTRENVLGFFTIFGLIAAAATIGLRWNLRVWLVMLALFYVPYALLYTAFFTNLDGFYSGHWNALDYWLAQQEVARGGQPWFYYLMLLPVYEFLPLVFAAPALFYYIIRGDVFHRFLVFWAVASIFGYSLAAEKFPWVSVNTTLPVILIAAVFLGDMLTSAAPRRAAQRFEHYALTAAAATLGVAAMALGLFGPEGSPWIALRILLTIVASLGILLLLLPVNVQQVAATALLRRRKQRFIQPWNRRRTTIVASSVVAGSLLAITLFIAVRVSYQWGDVPRELLVYTQTSPLVPDVVKNIQIAARRSGQDEQLPVVIDGGIEPWIWYLRDYKRVTYTGIADGYQPPPDAIVLVLAEHDSAMQPYIDQYAPPTQFPLRWWFNETYKTLPRNVFAFTGEFIQGLFRASTWDNWWDYFRNRRPPGSPAVVEDGLGRVDMVAYFPKQYGIEAPITTLPPQQPPAAAATVPPPVLPPQQLLAVNLVLGQADGDPGRFNAPGGLTIDSQGNLYVADTFNNRVLKFDPEGIILAKVGKKGSGDGQFFEPWGLTVDSQGNVYVADTFNHRIQKFDANLKFVLAWGKPASSLEKPEPDAFWGPRDVATDANGDVWVSDGGTGRVLKYSPDGRLLEAFGGLGSGPGQSREPTSIEIAPNGDIFLADSGNRRVQRFDASFGFLAEYAVPGWLRADSAAKPYIALLPDGGLIVSDPTQNKLFRLDAQGTAVTTLDAQDPALSLPRGVAFDSRGFVYVAEAGSSLVRRLVLSAPAP